jgi:hypothetical protein
MAMAISASAIVRADSPITSCDLSLAYADVPEVKRAAEKKRLDDELSAYLVAPGTPLDRKAAVVSALGFRSEPVGEADALARRSYGGSLEKVKRDALRADDLFVLGYLLALDDYDHPRRGLAFLDAARKKAPESLTIALVNALVRAQSVSGTVPCSTWRTVIAPLRDPKATVDLRKGAVDAIFDYVVLYRDACPPGA